MENVLDKQSLAKRFLLGNVSDSERAEIEDRFLANDDFYQELLIAEDTLIDAYVRDELPVPERALFEQRFLTSPSRRERVEFARTLFNSVSSKTAADAAPARVPDRSISWWQSFFGSPTMRHPALGFTMAAALLVIVLGALWFLTDRRRERYGVTQQTQTTQPTPATPRESSTPIQTGEQLETAEQLPHRDDESSNPTPVKETPKITTPVVATFTLVPGRVRGESDAGSFIIPVRTTQARLLLMLESEDYKQYHATLSSAEGRKLWSRRITKVARKKSANLTLSLPANLLKSGDYVLELSGMNPNGTSESVADYSFRVIKK